MRDDPRDTLFLRARNLEHELGVRRLFLKFEGSNPTGTQKDRIAALHYDDAHAKGFSVITLATCGNFGASLAYACSHNGIRPVVYVPASVWDADRSMFARRAAEMERHGTRVLRVEGDYEAAVEASRRAARENGWYDANPGPENWDLSRRGYGGIAAEIVRDLGRVPDTVSVSVGNGTTLAGIHDGFTALAGGSAGPSAVPRMIAASTSRGNPVIESFRQGHPECRDLRPEDVRETEVNEPLVNWHAFDGDRALHAVRTSGGFAAYASDAEMRRLTAIVREIEGINVLTASTAALVGLVKAVKKGAAPAEGDHVVVLTGRNFPAPRRSAPAPAPVAAKPGERVGGRA